MVAYEKAQQKKAEERKRLRGDRDQIKFIDLRFERGSIVRFRKAVRMQGVPQISCSWDEIYFKRMKIMTAKMWWGL